MGSDARAEAYAAAVRERQDLWLGHQGPLPWGATLRHPPVDPAEGASVDRADDEAIAAAHAGPPEIAVVCDATTQTWLCLRLLTAGTDLLLEPHVAHDLESAHALVDLAESAGRTLVTGGAPRFAPILGQVADLLAEGAIGAPYCMEWTPEPQASSKLARVEGARALDLLARLAGPIDQVRLSLGPPGGPWLETRHLDGALGVAHLADRPSPNPPGLCCRGPQGEIRVNALEALWSSPEGDQKLGEGLTPTAGCSEALETLLHRRVGEIVEDDGAHQLARIVDAEQHPDAWRAV